MKLDINAENFDQLIKKRCLEHFKNEFVVDDKSVIDKLLKMKKDDRQDEGAIKM